MRRAITLTGFVLAASTMACGQYTFMIHFDSLSNGLPGTAYGIEETDNGYLITGQQFSPDTFHQIHVFIRTIDHQGNFLGEREWWNGENKVYNQGILDPLGMDTGGYFGALPRRDPNLIYELDLFVVRFDENGDTLWTSHPIHTLNSDSVEFNVHQTIATMNGGYAMCGFYAKAGVNTQGWLLNLNGSGDTLWTRRYGPLGPPTSSTVFYSFSQFHDGGFLLGGNRLRPWVQDNNLLIRTNNTGASLWSQYFGEDSPGSNTAVRMAPDSTIVTWSNYREDSWFPPGAQVQDLRKWDENGTLIWSKKTLTQTSGNFAQDMEVLLDGSFICTGLYWNIAALWRFDANGDSLWMRKYWDLTGNGGGITIPYDVLPTSDGGFAFCGTSQQAAGDPHPNIYTMFVIKTDSLGCVVPGCNTVGVEEYAIDLQQSLSITPNPTRDQVRIELPLPEGYPIEGEVRLILMDAAGRALKEERVAYNGNGLSHLLTLAQFRPGLYHLHLCDERRWLAGGKVVVE